MSGFWTQGMFVVLALAQFNQTWIHTWGCFQQKFIYSRVQSNVIRAISESRTLNNVIGYYTVLPSFTMMGEALLWCAEIYKHIEIQIAVAVEWAVPVI